MGDVAVVSVPVVVVEPAGVQVVGAPGSVTPSPSASQVLVEGSTPVTTGAVSGVVLVPLESVLAMLWAL